MPSQLPKSLPPPRPTDHKIDLVPGAKPPAKAPYKMSLGVGRIAESINGVTGCKAYPAFQIPVRCPCSFPKEARHVHAYVCQLSGLE